MLIRDAELFAVIASELLEGFIGVHPFKHKSIFLKQSSSKLLIDNFKLFIFLRKSRKGFWTRGQSIFRFFFGSFRFATSGRGIIFGLNTNTLSFVFGLNGLILSNSSFVSSGARLFLGLNASGVKKPVAHDKYKKDERYVTSVLLV